MARMVGGSVALVVSIVTVAAGIELLCASIVVVAGLGRIIRGCCCGGCGGLCCCLWVNIVTDRAACCWWNSGSSSARCHTGGGGLLFVDVIDCDRPADDRLVT